LRFEWLIILGMRGFNAPVNLQVIEGKCELIGDTSTLESFRLAGHNDAIRPILEMLPVQMITIALAALAGREAGKFERAAKITTTE